MTSQTDERSPPTAAELAAECQRLIREIERKPRSIPLLLGALLALQRFAGYKAGRSMSERLARPP